MPEHGGQLRAAAARYRIPLADWLDLSTGVSPFGWPVPPLDARVWLRLPEAGDGLEAAAETYYGSANGMPVAGSQAAIQALPALFPQASVTCLSPLYNEHPHAWQAAGHQVREVVGASIDEALRTDTRHVVLCNPNNPTARRCGADALLKAAARLRERDGILLVDEAFIDATPDDSLAPLAGTEEAPNLIVLRSLGKFFGLAGARVGFVFATTTVRERLAARLGPWTVSGPAREVARLALADRAWQAGMRPRLHSAGRRLAALLEPLGEVGATALFATLASPQARALHEFLARRAILTRHFERHSLIRFGLPACEGEWSRLADALREARDASPLKA